MNLPTAVFHSNLIVARDPVQNKNNLSVFIRHLSRNINIIHGACLLSVISLDEEAFLML